MAKKTKPEKKAERRVEAMCHRAHKWVDDESYFKTPRLCECGAPLHIIGVVE